MNEFCFVGNGSCDFGLWTEIHLLELNLHGIMLVHLCHLWNYWSTLNNRWHPHFSIFLNNYNFHRKDCQISYSTQITSELSVFALSKNEVGNSDFRNRRAMGNMTGKNLSSTAQIHSPE